MLRLNHTKPSHVICCSQHWLQCYMNEGKVICYQLQLGKLLADNSTDCSSHYLEHSVETSFPKLKLVTDNFRLRQPLVSLVWNTLWH